MEWPCQGLTLNQMLWRDLKHFMLDNPPCRGFIYIYILILSFAISLKHVSVKNMPKIINEGGDKEFFTPLCTHAC